MNVYSKAMGTSMRKLFERFATSISEAALLTIKRHVEQASKNPRVDVESVRKIKYLHEFDRYCPSSPTQRT